MSAVNTRIVISAKDSATGVFRNTGLQVENLKRKVFSLNSAIAGFGLGLGGAEIYKQAKGFETALVDMKKVTNRELSLVRTDIESLPAVLGSSAELMRGYYQVMSASVTDPVKAMDLLTISARAAKGAHTSQAEVVKALTKTMAGYSGEIKNATQASDLLFSIEKVGQTNFAELVPVMGDLATISHSLGVKSYELGGALAQITQTAGSTAQAGTQYRAMLMGLYKPTENMQKLLAKMKYDSGKALIADKGLVGALKAIRGAADEAGISLGKVFESAEALTGMDAVSTKDFDPLVQKINEVREGAGGTEKAFKEWSVTLEGLETHLRNTLGNSLVSFSSRGVPAIKDGITSLSEGVTYLTHNLDELGQAAIVVGGSLLGRSGIAQAAVALARSSVQADKNAGSQAKLSSAIVTVAQSRRDATAAALAEARAQLKVSNSVMKTTGSYTAARHAVRDYARVGALEAKLATQTQTLARSKATLRTNIISANRALSTFRGGLRGVYGLLGGGYGLAITGVSSAIYYLSDNYRTAGESAQDFKKYVTSSAAAMDGAKKSAKELSASLQQISITNATNKLSELQKKAEEVEDSVRGRTTDGWTSKFGSSRSLSLQLESERGDAFSSYNKSSVEEVQNYLNALMEIDAKQGGLRSDYLNKQIQDTQTLIAIKKEQLKVEKTISSMRNGVVPAASSKKGGGSTPASNSNGGGGSPATSRPSASYTPTSDPLALVQAKVEMRTFAAEQQVTMSALDRLYADGKVKLEKYYAARRLKAEESARLQKEVTEAEYAHTIEMLEKKAAAEADQEAKKLILNEMIKEELLYKTELFEIDQKRIGILATLADKESKAHEEAAKKATSAWEDGAASMKSAGESVANTVGGAMGDMASGAEVSFASMANSIISSLMRIYVTQQLVSGLDGIMGNLFSDSSGAGGAATTPSLATGSQVDAVAGSLGSGWFYSPLNHSGGMVGQSFSAMRNVPASLFSGASRYHTGGEILRPGEVPIIAEVGERVLTREQNAGYERMRNTPAAAPQININITNEDGTKSEVTNEESFFDGERWVCDMWMRAYKNNTNGIRDNLGGGR